MLKRFFRPSAVSGSAAVAFLAAALSLPASALLSQEEGSESPKVGPPKPVKAAQATDSDASPLDVLNAAKADLEAVVEDRVFGRPSDEKAVQIVERYLEAIGGTETLGAVEDRMAKFRNVKYSATGETVAVIALYMMRGNKYREEWEIEGFKIKDEPLAFVQIYNGDQQAGWVKMLGTVSPLEGRTLSVFVWDKYLDDFFANWEADGYSLTMAGAGLVNDTEECDIVMVTDFSGRQQIRYFFSRESGLLLKKEWMDATGKDTVKKEQYYKLYRPIPFGSDKGKKILFPLKLEIHQDGTLDTERIYTQVKYNDQLSDKLFDKPDGVPFTGGITGKDDLKKRAIQAATGQSEGDAPATGPSTGAPHGTRKKEGSRTRRGPRRTTTTPPAPKTDAPDKSKVEP